MRVETCIDCHADCPLFYPTRNKLQYYTANSSMRDVLNIHLAVLISLHVHRHRDWERNTSDFLTTRQKKCNTQSSVLEIVNKSLYVHRDVIYVKQVRALTTLQSRANTLRTCLCDCVLFISFSTSAEIKSRSYKRSLYSVLQPTATRSIWLCLFPDVSSACWITLKVVLPYKNIEIARNNVITNILKSNVDAVMCNKSK